MKHLGQNKQGKATLLEALKDQNHPFTKDELEVIINNEFFNDENLLNTDLVDAAITRMLLIDGVDLNEATLKRARESLIRGVFEKILKPKQ